MITHLKAFLFPHFFPKESSKLAKKSIFTFLKTLFLTKICLCSDYSYDYDDDYSEGRGSHEYGRGVNSPGQYLQGYDYNSGPYGNFDYNDVSGRNGPGGPSSPGGGPGIQGGYRHPNGHLFDYRSSNSEDYSDFNSYDPHKYYDGSHSRAGYESSSESGYGYENTNPYSQEHFYY